MSRRPTADELIPTDEELAAARTAASAPQEDTAWGGGIGTALGAGAGALLSIPSFGTLAPVLIPAGAGVGGALGSAIGGSIGNAQAKSAGDTLTADQAARAKLLNEDAEREAALKALMATR
jgi:hypothetical protein